MNSRLSYPHEEILAKQMFSEHHFATNNDLRYLGTHYNLDVYITLKNGIIGSMYCVYGNEPHEYYCAVHTCIKRSNSKLDSVPAYVAAGYAALLHNPSFIALVVR